MQIKLHWINFMIVLGGYHGFKVVFSNYCILERKSCMEIRKASLCFRGGTLLKAGPFLKHSRQARCFYMLLYEWNTMRWEVVKADLFTSSCAAPAGLQS